MTDMQTWDALGDWISFLSGGALLLFSLLVLIAYRPRGTRSGPERVLALAIALSFIATAGNTLYWQVLGQPLVRYGWMTVGDIRFWGDYLDLLFKGGGALAGYLHLRALWLCLPPPERRAWPVWEIAFYPHRILFVRRRRPDDED